MVTVFENGPLCACSNTLYSHTGNFLHNSKKFLPIFSMLVYTCTCIYLYVLLVVLHMQSEEASVWLRGSTACLGMNPP